MATYHNAEDIQAFFRALKESSIRYLLLKNMGGELPSRLPLGKDIDLLVHPADYGKLPALMQKAGFRQMAHPYGKESGWGFLYAMRENAFFVHTENRLIVDACAQLATKCLGMRAWIPLDRKLQEAAWRDRAWNEDMGWYALDESTLAVYLVVRAMFEKHGFPDMYRQEIEERKELLLSEEGKEKLGLVFFRFTSTLLERIRQGAYEGLFDTYCRFTGY
ncbi:MAG: hypothetical protein IJT01_04640 [Selenomonadaceae bacterium]|nr:hypothetical protein [Selenomonadaceae bacterium]